MVSLRVIQPVTEPTDWVSSVANSQTSNGRWRICLDPKDLNRAIEKPLDEESSYLTTFNSPFGRFRFTRLPFGLCVSQDVFQQKMDFILEKCPGAVGIADDIAVHGPTEKRAWWKFTQLNVSCTAAWTCFQLGQMPYQGDQDHILRHVIWCRRSTSWPRESGGHQGHTGTAGHPGIPNLPWHSNLHGPFYSKPVCHVRASEKSP